jgi:site-specific recombinase XerD
VSESPKTLTRQDCDALLKELNIYQGTDRQRSVGHRNICMALLMLDAGLRVGELVQLRKSHLWFSSWPVKTIILEAEITKYKIDRQIPVSDRLSKAILQLAESYWSGENEPLSDFAFHQGKFDHPITTRQVERIIRSAAIASLGRPIHPHVLRHTFATNLMKVTNASVVQALLGHKHLSSTQVYCHPDSEDLKKAITDSSKNGLALSV